MDGYDNSPCVLSENMDVLDREKMSYRALEVLI